MRIDGCTTMLHRPSCALQCLHRGNRLQISVATYCLQVNEISEFIGLHNAAAEERWMTRWRY